MTEKGALLAALVTLALSFAPRAARAQDTHGEARYRALVTEAVAEYDAGRWAEARALFVRAHELAPNARTLRGIGMASFELGDYIAALRALRAALADPRRPLPRDQRAQVEDLAERATRFTARYRVRTVPRDAALAVDGEPAEREPDGTLLLDVGEHVLTATRDGHAPVTQPVRVVGGEARSLTITLSARAGAPVVRDDHAGDASATHAGPGTGSIVLLVTAGALAAVAIGAGVWWADRGGEVSACESPPSGTLCPNQDRLETQRDVAAGMTIGAGVLAIASGAIGLVLLSADGVSDERAAAVVCGAAGLGAGCRMTF